MEISMDMETPTEAPEGIPLWGVTRRVRLDPGGVVADVTVTRGEDPAVAVTVFIRSKGRNHTVASARYWLTDALRRGRGRNLKGPRGFLRTVAHHLAEGAVVL